MVLLGKDFGGCHHGYLCACFDGGQRRERGHDGFAAAHIPLQQAVHRVRLRQILADFGQHAILSSGKGEGQALHQRLGETAVAHQRHGLPTESMRTSQAHGKLLGEQFVKFQPLPGRQAAIRQLTDAVFGRRCVQKMQTFGQRRQLELGKQAFR